MNFPTLGGCQPPMAIRPLKTNLWRNLVDNLLRMIHIPARNSIGAVSQMARYCIYAPRAFPPRTWAVHATALFLSQGAVLTGIRQGGVADAEGPLHQDAVHPLPQFEADRRQHARPAEAKALMQGDRGLIAGVANHGHHLAEACLGAAIDQCPEGEPLDAEAAAIRGDIYRILDGIAISGSQPIRPRI